MNIKEAFFSALKNWKNFHGRASRSEFWYFVLASFLLGIIVFLFELSVGIVDIESGNRGILSIALELFLAIPYISVTSRRIQDRGYSGWWQLSYLTIIGIFVILIWCMLPAKEDENKWGRNPLLER
tara:strand:+ start:361 stop:738 length:378 start_codon:yes stop_codon:yes gene_type:complete